MEPASEVKPHVGNANILRTGILPNKQEVEVQHVEPMDKMTALLVRGAIVSTTLAGLLIYVRRSPKFARFQHLSQIPFSVVNKEQQLKGVVRSMTPSGLLKVEHVPSVKLPWPLVKRKPVDVGLLNLRLAALEVSPVGMEYLHKDLRLDNKPIAFTVVKPAEGNPDAVDAEILAKKNFFSRTNLNTELVRRGYARIPTMDQHSHVKALEENAIYSRLVCRLLTCEKVASARNIGIWSRSTWVEEVESFPSALGQMVRGSAITKLAILLFHVLQDATMLVYRLLKQGYYLTRTLLGYLLAVYNSLARGIHRLSHFYAKQRQRLTDKTTKKIAEGQEKREVR